MFKLESPTELAARLELPNSPDILGYALWYTKGEKEGFIQKFKFKFDAVNPDKNSFGYTVLKSPTNKTPADSYVYDLETALMVQGVFKWFTEVSPQIHYVYTIQVDGKTVLNTSIIQNVLS
jgi:hypothetical protein